MARRHKGRQFRRQGQKSKPGQPQAAAPKQQATSYSTYAWADCSHWRDLVQLENGLTLIASGYADRPKHKNNSLAVRYETLSVYLDRLWEQTGVLATPGIDLPFPGGKHRYVMYPWADMSVPDDMEEFVTLVKWMLTQIVQGERVEIGCFGGHGRTGTLIAAILIAQGLTAAQAVNKVRTQYCQEAIETARQVNYLVAFDMEVNQRQPMPDEYTLLNKLRADSWKGNGYTTTSNKSGTVVTSSRPTVPRTDFTDDTGAVLLRDEQQLLDQWLEEHDDSDSAKDVVQPWWGRQKDGTMGWQFMAKNSDGDWELCSREEWEKQGTSIRNWEAQSRKNDDLCAFPPCQYADQCEPEEHGGCHREMVATMIDDYQKSVEEYKKGWSDVEDF